jgi:hypothetical protein
MEQRGSSKSKRSRGKMIDKPTIYLAGAMSGLTWREALGWRRECEAELSKDWCLINPVRAQVRDDQMDEIIKLPSKEEYLPLHLTSSGICAQDEFFINKSDWLLCYYVNAKGPSFGTVWEQAKAWEAGKLILSVITPGSLHDHPFTRRRSHVFTPHLHEAIDFFKAIAL